MSIQYWCGTEDSYQVYQAALKQDTGEDDSADLYERVGDVGVVHISGSLIPGEARWMSAYGITGYSDIRAALVKAVDDKEVSSIMLDVNSGGGAVTGMSDTAAFISKVSKLKPVTVYAENAASAAYRLAAEGSHITVSDSGIVGSIGVLRVHTEYSKMEAMEGITTTVLRSGEFKSLMNPMEPLSEAAIAQEQPKLDYLAQSFSVAVASRRGLTAEDMKSKAGEGRTFIGKQGVSAKLADAVGSYESALKTARKQPKPANRTAAVAGTKAEVQNMSENTSNTEGLDMNKPTLSPEHLAAIEAGVDLTEQPVASVVAALPDPEPVAAAASVQDDSEVVKFLKAELATASVNLATQTATITSLNTELASIKATQEALLQITKTACANMSVALGGSKEAFASMPVDVVLAEHKTLSDKFKSSFKVGGVAASSPVEEKKTAKPSFDPFFAALIRKPTAK